MQKDTLHINRREFVALSAKAGIAGFLSNSPFQLVGKESETTITILHTNDWHSRIEPFETDGGPLSGMGGAARRAAIIAGVRKESEHVLLLDAGDIFQGTPYFNYFKGELEYKLMSEMQYDCVTLGNHDFDNGIDGIVQMLPHASFGFVNANYDFSKTPLKDIVKPYKIFMKGDIRIGVFGIGIELKGLVPDKLYGDIIYRDPVMHANEVASYLRRKKKCDLVICLSHLGYSYKSEKISDLKLASQTRNIDLIIGGHTHTFLPEPVVVKNMVGKDVTINQVGWAGVRIGRIDYTFNPLTGKQLAQTCTQMKVLV